MLHRVVGYKLSDMSEVLTASIIRAIARQKAPLKRRSICMKLHGETSEKAAIFFNNNIFYYCYVLI
jgi:hypothetical protein